MLLFGYLLAATAPVVLGLVRDATGNFESVVWILVGIAALMIPLALALNPGAPASRRRLTGVARRPRPTTARRGRSGTTTSRSTPDSAPQASPGRPSIWRTAAFARVDSKDWNVSVSGSNRRTAFWPKSVTQTASSSST